MKKWAAAWERFWFESDGRAQLRVFRTLFGFLLLGCYLIRTLDLELYYGPGGIMPLEALGELLPMEFRLSIFHHLTGRAALWIGNSVFLASLFSLALGKAPRLSAIVALVLHLSFIHRNPAVSYGVDLISCFFLLFLCLADSRGEREYRAGDLRATLGSMAYRLFQIQVCVIYGYSGLKKLKGAVWWSGDAMWASLAQWQLARWDFSPLAHVPLVLAGFTFLTLAWEIYFPALIWFKPLRVPMLVLGAGMHLGIALALNLPFFAALMVFSYVVFLDRAQLAWIGRRVESAKNKFGFFKVPRPVSE